MAENMHLNKFDCDATLEWPKSRGVFISEGRKTMLHVNGKEHLCFLSLSSPSHFPASLDSMFDLITRFEDFLKSKQRQFANMYMFIL